eukprot:CAMPEP_0115851704 /NCGR_PEP_ID=MMETSP0287-20121206/12618_1 /TAXON_ID=412157 /ORGANISM="Chrysochromulina rotalis, Strain UIO044" /LENGTH=144 /DNA_ID=CAMNT_0003305743 /DNA_START=418 /DNA_END=852 /DNA_ORIENTATION=+
MASQSPRHIPCLVTLLEFSAYLIPSEESVKYKYSHISHPSRNERNEEVETPISKAEITKESMMRKQDREEEERKRIEREEELLRGWSWADAEAAEEKMIQAHKELEEAEEKETKRKIKEAREERAAKKQRATGATGTPSSSVPE